MSESSLRVGVLGTGAIAQTVHLPVLSTLPGVEIAAVCDVARSKAEAIATRFEIPTVYRHDEDLLADEAIDAVVICTPNGMHGEQVVEALSAGKHVLVERPLALDAERAGEAVEAAVASERTLTVALNNRFRPDVRAIRPFLRTGELGEVFFVRAGWFHRRMPPARRTWRHDREVSGGGAFMDLGVQALDLCLWLLDYPEVERVTAHAHPAGGRGVEDSATALFGLAGGGFVSVDVSWSVMEPRDRHNLQILASGGSARLAPLAVHKELGQGLADVTPQLVPDRENIYMASYREELREFVEAARGERVVEPPREQPVLMRLVERAYASMEKGKEVAT